MYVTDIINMKRENIMKATEELKETEVKTAAQFSDEELSSVSGGTHGPTKRLIDEAPSMTAGGRIWLTPDTLDILSNDDTSQADLLP